MYVIILFNFLVMLEIAMNSESLALILYLVSV
jgi:hypothetical protein